MPALSGQTEGLVGGLLLRKERGQRDLHICVVEGHELLSHYRQADRLRPKMSIDQIAELRRATLLFRCFAHPPEEAVEDPGETLDVVVHGSGEMLPRCRTVPVWVPAGTGEGD